MEHKRAKAQQKLTDSNNRRAAIRVESDALAAKAAKIKAAHSLGLALAIVSGVTPTRTSVSPLDLKFVSRATLNRPQRVSHRLPREERKLRRHRRHARKLRRGY